MVLDYCIIKPEFLFWVIFCVYILLYAGLHLTVAQILYTMHVLFHIYRGYIYCSNFCYHVLTEFNTAFGGWLLQSPHCQIQETTNSQAYTCVYLYPSWAHSLVHAQTVGSTECGHSGLKCMQWRAPASWYIVAFIEITASTIYGTMYTR